MASTIDEFLDHIINDSPSSQTLFLLLDRKRQEGRLKEVIGGCLKALSRYPGDIRIRGLLAESCFESGWLSQAEAEVERATAQVEELASIYMLKARVYLTMNRKEEAIESLRIYLAHRSDDAEATSILLSLSPPAPPLHPVEMDKDSLQESPFSSLPEIATPTLAELYFAQGQVQEAITTYEKVLAQNPEVAQFRIRIEELKSILSPFAPKQEEGDGSGEDEKQRAQRSEDRGQEELPSHPDDRLRRKKERMIEVLSAWRESLKTVSSKQQGKERS